MKKKEFDEDAPLFIIAKFYQEKLIMHSDIDHKNISVTRAKEILGKMYRIPTSLQTRWLYELQKVNLLKNKDCKILEILPVN